MLILKPLSLLRLITFLHWIKCKTTTGATTINHLKQFLVILTISAYFLVLRFQFCGGCRQFISHWGALLTEFTFLDYLLFLNFHLSQINMCFFNKLAMARSACNMHFQNLLRLVLLRHGMCEQRKRAPWDKSSA